MDALHCNHKRSMFQGATPSPLESYLMWSNALQSTNTLITRPLSGSRNCAVPVPGPRHISYSDYLCCTPDIAAEETIYIVFSFYAVWGRDSNLSNSRKRHLRNIQLF